MASGFPNLQCSGKEGLFREALGRELVGDNHRFSGERRILGANPMQTAQEGKGSNPQQLLVCSSNPREMIPIAASRTKHCVRH